MKTSLSTLIKYIFVTTLILFIINQSICAQPKFVLMSSSDTFRTKEQVLKAYIDQEKFAEIDKASETGGGSKKKHVCRLVEPPENSLDELYYSVEVKETSTFEDGDVKVWTGVVPYVIKIIGKPTITTSIDIKDEVKVAAKGDEGRPASSNGSSNSRLPNVGEELSVPYKDGRARAKVLDTSGRFVTVSEKSKSASGDVKHSILKDTFRAQLASKEIIRWTEERTRLMVNRPPYKKGLVETVWNNAKRPDGSVHDPAEPFEKLEWVKEKSRYNQWHMGHVNDHQYSKLVDEFVDGKIDWDKFIDEYNKAENYAPELPIKNMKKGVNAEPKP